MKPPTSPTADFARDDDRQLDDLLERIGNLVEAGDLADAEAVIDDHPHYAQRLRRVLPAIEALAAFDELAPDPTALTPTADIGAPELQEKTLGDFRIVREVGRGGMGVVYEARQISLGRRVALKVLPYAALLDARQLQRFQNEARVAAGLHHTNIVPVYTVGSERGVYYYAMQFIDGRDLANVIDGMRNADDGLRNQQASGPAQSAIDVPQAEIATVRNEQALIETPVAPDTVSRYRTAADWAAAAAEALAYAHSVGVLHRDIKPANLLVDEAGALWVSDFGLARLETDANLTATGDVLGTLRYMSPEQARGDRTAVDGRTDVYALGVTLYELLTLRPAQPAGDRQRLMADIAEKDPTPPGRVDPHIPGDLDAIVQKAMEKDPADRYQTAAALAADLHNFLESRPVVARPPSLASRTRKWLRRHQSVVRASVTTLVAALSVSAVALMFAFQQERDQRQLAQQHLQLARQTVDEMLTKVATTWIADDTATSKVQRQFLQRALEIYQQLAAHPPDGDRRSADAARAHERIADIYVHLGRTAKAIPALETALDIHRNLAGVDPTATDLVRCYRKLATRQVGNWESQLAKQTVERGLDEARRFLENKLPAPKLQRELVRLLYVRAEMLLHEGKFDEAAAVVASHEAQLMDRLDLTENDPLDDLVLGAQLSNLQVTIQRRQGRLELAAQTARAAVLRYGRARNSLYYDAKQLVELDADLNENLAEVFLAQGELQKSVRGFRAALGLRGQRLGDRTPTQLSMAIGLDRQQRLSPRHFEGPALASFVNTQLRLAAALPLVNRPYEARCVSGEALQAAQLINDSWRGDLRYWVLHAGAAASVGGLLAEQDDAEAEHYLQLASAVWNEARAGFPRAEQYCSGIHPRASDWDWFAATFPKHASQTGSREERSLDNWETAFWNHVVGRGWFQHEGWQKSLGLFAKAAELREDGQAFDWFHLAMAYHRLGRLDEAQREHDRAVAQLEDLETRDAELESLRRRAARLLADDNSPDTN